MSTPVSSDYTFLRRFISEPGRVASPVPSGRRLAERVAAEINPSLRGDVLELGPGTGAVTRAILARGIEPYRLIAIEYDPEFAAMLREQHPQVAVIEGNAFDFLRLLNLPTAGQLSAIVSGLPVLSQSGTVRDKLMQDARAALRRGGTFVQFSYSFIAPLPCPAGMSMRHAAVEWLNLPPMNVWSYRVK